MSLFSWWRRRQHDPVIVCTAKDFNGAYYAFRAFMQMAQAEIDARKIEAGESRTRLRVVVKP